MKHSVKLKCLKMHRSFFNLIGHGVVMESNRKMTGFLQTCGGHCIIVTIAVCTGVRMPGARGSITQGTPVRDAPRAPGW